MPFLNVPSFGRLKSCNVVVDLVTLVAKLNSEWPTSNNTLLLFRSQERSGKKWNFSIQLIPICINFNWDIEKVILTGAIRFSVRTTRFYKKWNKYVRKESLWVHLLHCTMSIRCFLVTSLTPISKNRYYHNCMMYVCCIRQIFTKWQNYDVHNKELCTYANCSDQQAHINKSLKMQWVYAKLLVD